MSNVVICNKCNTKTLSSATNCPNCGEPFKKNNFSWKHWMLGFLLLLLIIGFLTDDNNQNKNNSQITSNEVSPIQKTISPKDEVIKNTIIEEFNGYKDGFGNILMADFKIKNISKYTIKDIEITCDSFANSGTHIDSNSRIIYEAINPNNILNINKFNMGFISSQVVNSTCYITNLQIK